MSVFYMKLIGKHGKVTTKVATQQEEVDQDKKRGWVEFDPYEKSAEVKSPAAQEKNARQAVL